MSKQLIFIRKNHCYNNLLDHEEHEEHEGENPK